MGQGREVYRKQNPPKMGQCLKEGQKSRAGFDSATPADTSIMPEYRRAIEILMPAIRTSIRISCWSEKIGLNQYFLKKENGTS
jgi:hypothetical protein